MSEYTGAPVVWKAQIREGLKPRGGLEITQEETINLSG